MGALPPCAAPRGARSSPRRSTASSAAARPRRRTSRRCPTSRWSSTSACASSRRSRSSCAARSRTTSSAAAPSRPARRWPSSRGSPTATPRSGPTPPGSCPSASPTRASASDKLSFLPFGAGQRICLGEFMGQLEGKIMVAMLLQRYDLRLVPGFDPRCRGFISLQPLNGMRMICRRREPSRSARAVPSSPADSASAPSEALGLPASPRANRVVTKLP